MALQSSGAISFSEITNEFGSPPAGNLGAYRISQNVGTLSNLPLDTGIPQSGAIKFSHFYGKRLNVVINYTNIPQNSTRLNARTTYNNNNNLVVVGGFRTRPSSPQNIKIIININTVIGSVKGDITNVAFRTGNWTNSAGNALTSVEMQIGSSGQIYGAGGDGGSSNGNNGSNGTSAIGIDYPTTIINRGRIQAGGGGGGGGGYAYQVIATGKKGKGNVPSYSTGGGGGGGAGLPVGNGALAATGAYGFGSNGSGGSNGTITSGGNKGAAGSFAGDGGNGGSGGDSGESGTTVTSAGGLGGSAGYAVVVTSFANAETPTVQNVDTGVVFGSRFVGNPT
jgi:hypothetical protein